jgi:hypothetical protein
MLRGCQYGNSVPVLYHTLIFDVLQDVALFVLVLRAYSSYLRLKTLTVSLSDVNISVKIKTALSSKTVAARFDK